MRVVTRLAQFDGRSRLKTWVYRVATNYLLDVRRAASNASSPRSRASPTTSPMVCHRRDPAAGERSVLTEEVKLGCTLAMLQCLDRPHRIAYIIGRDLRAAGAGGGRSARARAAAFRKRLQRARDAVEAFTRAHCGLVSDDAACRCHRRVNTALRIGRNPAGAARARGSPHLVRRGARGHPTGRTGEARGRTSSREPTARLRCRLRRAPGIGPRPRTPTGRAVSDPAESPGFVSWVDSLARQHTRGLASLAAGEGLGPDEALDAVQEAFATFLVLPQARGLARHRDDSFAFLTVIVRNAARNIRKRHHRARPHDALGAASLVDDSPPRTF